MQIVTGFDSSDKRDVGPLDDYRRFVDSLDRRNLEIVDISFVRLAKRELRASLPDASYLEAKNVRDVRPIWVCEWSVVLDIPERDDRTKSQIDDICMALKGLIDEISGTIRRTSGDAPIGFVDPLSSRIVQVGPRSLRFIAKQRWCRNG